MKKKEKRERIMLRSQQILSDILLMAVIIKK